MTGSCLDAALAYAARGWRVFPVHRAARRGTQVACTCGKRCSTPGKHPITRRGVKDATVDEETIRDWFTEWPLANVGLACGAASGVVVVDVDPRNGGGKTFEGLGIGKAGGVEAESGGGGQHLFYAWPERSVKLPGNLGPGVDLVGEGKYVVLPPSVHVSGRRYTWKVGPEGGLGSADDLSGALAKVAGVKGKAGENGHGAVSLTPMTRERALEILAIAAATVQLADEGERNTVLSREAYSLGGIMARGLLSGDEVQVALETAARVAGLDEKEIARTVARCMSAGVSAPRAIVAVASGDEGEASLGPEHPGFDWTEAGLARRLVTVLEGQGERLVGEYGCLWRYAEAQGVWRPIVEADLVHTVLGWHGFREGKSVLNVTRNKLTNACYLAQALRSAPGFFDATGTGIAFTNISWVGGQGLRTHSPEHRLTVAADVPYRADSQCPRWERLLDRILGNEGSIRLLQEWTGAALTGQTHRFQAYLVLTGTGRNGKSILLEVISGLFPPELVTAIPPHDMTDRVSRAALARARLNVVTEMPAEELKNAEALKAIVTGDVVGARENYGKLFTYRPRVACLFAANELPVVKDQSLGFWRRCYVLPTAGVLVEGALPPGQSAKVLQEEKAGVLAWALAGLQRLTKRGHLMAPLPAEEAKEVWRIESDQVAQWQSERTTTVPDTWTPISDLYRDYRVWAVESGHARMSLTLFGRRLRTLSVLKKHSKNGALYQLSL